MTCSEQFLLLRARYGVLRVLYIILFPLLSFRTAQHVLQLARMHPEWRQIKAN